MGVPVIAHLKSVWVAEKGFTHTHTHKHTHTHTLTALQFTCSQGECSLMVSDDMSLVENHSPPVNLE